jgi:hypothetical protein
MDCSTGLILDNLDRAEGEVSVDWKSCDAASLSQRRHRTHEILCHHGVDETEGEETTEDKTLNP